MNLEDLNTVRCHTYKSALIFKCIGADEIEIYHSTCNQAALQIIQRELALSDQLAAALETNLVFVDPGTNAAARIRAAPAQHAATRSGK